MTQKITIFIAFFLLIAAGLAQAQMTDRQRQLLHAQDVTGEIIHRAREIVAESGSIRARNLLQAAVRLHAKSIEVFDLNMNGFGEQYMLQSGKLTFSAREKARRSIAITRQARENEDNVRRRIEQATEHLRRAEEMIGSQSVSPPGARQIIQTARQKLERAREFFLDRRLKAALQMLLQTEHSLGKLKGRVGGLASADQRYQNLVEMFISARERIGCVESPGQSFTERLRQVDQIFAQAQTLAEAGDYVGAVRILQKGVNQIKRMAEKIKAPPRVATALDRTRQQAQDINEAVAASSDRRVEKIYANLNQRLYEAGKLLEKGQYDRATIQIQAANQLLARLTRLLGE